MSDKDITEWLQQAPPHVKSYMRGSIHLCNFLHEERNRGFQFPGKYDGAMSADCAAEFRDQYEICDTIIKTIRTWA